MKYILSAAVVLTAAGIFARYRFGMRPVNSDQKIYEEEKKIVRIPFGDRQIYGELLSPKGKKAKTLIIGSHGFNGSYIYFRQALGHLLSQEGYALYAFDFFNGSRRSRSGGVIEKMSALEETKQLIAVLRYFEKDYENVILAGESQGGLVSTLAFGQIKDRVKALILYYPAYCAVSDAVKRYEAGNTHELFGIHFVSDYTKELISIDLDEAIRKIDVPCLLIHGDSDRTVDVAYAKKAKQLNPKIELHILAGKDHGFDQEGRVAAGTYVHDFLIRNGL